MAETDQCQGLGLTSPPSQTNFQISLQTSGGDLFADTQDADMDCDGEENKGHQGKSKASTGKQTKAGGKSSELRIIWCYLCKCDKQTKPNKAACEDCNPDIEAMRRDAKASGQKAKVMLANIEKEIKKDPTCEDLTELHKAWIASAGRSTGSSRMGFFHWAKYEEAFIARQGTLAQLGRVLVTRKEFITAMQAKGRSEEWANSEWTRRQNNAEFRKGVCPDTGLPTVQMHEGPREIDYTDKAKEQRVIQGTKEAKPETDDVKEQVKLVSRAVTDVARSTSFAAFKGEGDGDGMEALMATGSGSLDFWKKQVEPENQQPDDTATGLGDQASPGKGECHYFDTDKARQPGISLRRGIRS